uniref:Uncharacterized protein n=1 Tax=Vespula pensylvanica TaxID=30213 RepID=A0A834NCL7_VESPE|nr:hypothetical protein H0235_014991 [Vespula pensylvanica]
MGNANSKVFWESISMRTRKIIFVQLVTRFNLRRILPTVDEEKEGKVDPSVFRKQKRKERNKKNTLHLIFLSLLKVSASRTIKANLQIRSFVYSLRSHCP